MPKSLLLIISLTVIIITAFSVYTLNNESRSYTNYKPGHITELDTAINQAKFLYEQYKQQGTDFSKGPCLSNALMSGWVLDIVHNPRQPVDDLTENQCSALVEGKVPHFVELDINGNLVRAR